MENKKNNIVMLIYYYTITFLTVDDKSILLILPHQLIQNNEHPRTQNHQWKLPIQKFLKIATSGPTPPSQY